MDGFSFKLKKKLGEARLSELSTPHGTVPGPFFQFVATQAAIRGQVYSEDLEKIGVDIILSNTYHLHLRPGEKTIQAAGGLHGFMQWNKPITTDSGGYQVFSLGKHVKLDADGVNFRSPLNGDMHRLTPEKTIQIETALGADIIMPLDVCTPFDASKEDVAKAVTQTQAWAKRCLAEHELQAAQRKNPQALYGIVQGGLYPDLREKAAVGITELGFFGYSIGGELRDVENSAMDDGVRMTVRHLPENAPRYLMGAGAPEDIVRAVRVGVDQFDCVLPVRNARHGKIYRDLNIDELKQCLLDPERPVEPNKLYTVFDIRKNGHADSAEIFSPGNPAIVKPYTVGFVHHLLRAEPPSGYRLAVLQNIYFYKELMAAIRACLEESGI